MTISVAISEAAAELLVEAHEAGRFGVELGGIFDRGLGRELEAEGLGAVRLECETHGLGCDCDSELTPIFIINDAGEVWLDDAGRLPWIAPGERCPGVGSVGKEVVP